MSSIGHASGVTSPYTPLEFGSLSELGDTENIVILIVEGLGYNYLREFGGGSILKKKLKESISSVYLPTTGSAIT
jgi:hypothetical protein